MGDPWDRLGDEGERRTADEGLRPPRAGRTARQVRLAGGWRDAGS